jgi:hypothetical protein
MDVALLADLDDVDAMARLIMKGLCDNTWRCSDRSKSLAVAQGGYSLERCVEQTVGVYKEYILERARQWPFPVRIISDLDRDRALAYLKEGERLAIIASLAENFANTVQECCGMGIPFLASAVGGIPERIAPEDRKRICFVPRPGNLANRLVQALEEGVHRTRSAVDFKSNRKIWTDWHEPPEKNQSLPGAKADGSCDLFSSYPLVSVCLTTFNRPHLLAQALESLRSQDYPNFEVLLVDDGSDQPEALAFLDRLEPEFKAGGWRIIRQENSQQNWRKFSFYCRRAEGNTCFCAATALNRVYDGVIELRRSDRLGEVGCDDGV